MDLAVVRYRDLAEVRELGLMLGGVPVAASPRGRPGLMGSWESGLSLRRQRPQARCHKLWTRRR